MDQLPNLISLKVKCPVCGQSLMDRERPVDNCPSIKLNVEVGKKKGVINLSSVWESYNYLCTIETPKKKILKLSCPHCKSEIRGKADCDVCEAPMIPLDLEVGGDICICSRMGCKNHFVKFVDFSFALKRLYVEAGHQGRPYVEDLSSIPRREGPLTEEEERNRILRTGTFLRTYCPHCRKSLIEDDSIKLKVDRGDREGFLMLSPYLNIFTSRSTIRLPEDKALSNIRCFHCNEPLVISGESCEECGNRVIHLVVSATSRLVDFYVCSKKGCTWHGISREDLNDIRLEQSMEW
jgi:hypothetical protein